MSDLDQIRKKHLPNYDGLKQEIENRSITEYEAVYGSHSIEDYDKMLAERNDQAYVGLQRTYYFVSADLLEAKAERYKKMSEDENGDVAKFAKTHKNRSARKRKKSAAAAAKKFRAAEELAKETKSSMEGENLYTHETAIMKLRLEARIEAAKAKAGSAEEEKYRIAKAKYSSTSVLLNQVNDILRGSKHANNKNLLAERAKLEKQLERQRKELQSTMPDSKECWEKTAVSKDSVAKKLKEYRKKYNPDINEEDIKLSMYYQTFLKAGEAEQKYIEKKIRSGHGVYGDDGGDQDRIYRSMCENFYMDKHGRPLTAADAEIARKNRKWIDLCADDSKYRLEKAKKEGAQPKDIAALEDEVKEKELERNKFVIEKLRKFDDEVKLPEPKDVNKDNLIKLMKEDPARFAYLVHISTMTNNLAGEDPFVAEYFKSHPALNLKMNAYIFMTELLREVMENEHLIRQNMDNVTKLSEKEPVEDEATFYKQAYEDYMKAQVSNEKKKEIRDKEDLELKKREEEIELSKKVHEFGRNLDKKESIEYFKAINPTFTDEAYEKYSQMVSFRKEVKDPRLKAQADRAAEKYKKNNTHLTLTRAYAPLLKSVKYNDLGEPADPVSVENFKWNNEVMEAVEKGEEEKDSKMEKIVLSELTKLFEDTKSMLPPEPENLEKYLDDMFDDHMEDFSRLMNKYLGVSNLKAISKSAEGFIKDHPDFDAVFDLMTTISTILQSYTQIRYKVNLMNLGQLSSAVSKEEHLHMAEGSYEVIKMQYAEQYETYKAVIEKIKEEKKS